MHLLALLLDGRYGGEKRVTWGVGRSVTHSARAVIGVRGSLLPRCFDTSESRGVLADLTACVGRSWSVGLAPLGSVRRPARTIARRAPRAKVARRAVRNKSRRRRIPAGRISGFTLVIGNQDPGPGLRPKGAPSTKNWRDVGTYFRC